MAITNPVEKADTLNQQFHSVFTSEDDSNNPDKGVSLFPSLKLLTMNLRL